MVPQLFINNIWESTLFTVINVNIELVILLTLISEMYSVIAFPVTLLKI